jgi:hypothetical protein
MKRTGMMTDARSLRLAHRVDDVITIERKMNAGCAKKLTYDDILPPPMDISWSITAPKNRDWKYLLEAWLEKEPSPERDAFIAECRAELAKQKTSR